MSNGHGRGSRDIVLEDGVGVVRVGAGLRKLMSNGRVSMV
jgi:hypothetical protein